VLNTTSDTPAQIANLALFSNVQSSGGCWSGMENASRPDFAWIVSPSAGFQSSVDKGSPLYAVALRPGDVAASVPEPQTLALALLALGATTVVRRRRPR